MKPTVLAAAVSALLACGSANSALAETPPQPKTVYHIGNSLTFGLSLDRLAKLFASQGVTYDYGTQMGAGIPLSAHVTKIHGFTGKPFKRNNVESKPFTSDHEVAFANHTFDAVVIQPYLAWLETDEFKAMAEARGRTWNPQQIGDRQAMSILIARALGDNSRQNTASPRFYLYATWPRLSALNPPRGEPKTFAEHWASPYNPKAPSPAWAVPNRVFFDELLRRVNEDNPQLERPVKLIPVGEVLARLDVMIRDGTLPGFEAYMMRDSVPVTADGTPLQTRKGPARSNREYYRTARLAPNRKTGEVELVAFFPFEGTYNQAFGVQNLYCDAIHMNDQPHAKTEDGTLGAYIAALTIYSVMTGQSPVGLPADAWERIDPKADAELIRAVQETVWQVVQELH
ncbi:MAG: hypothetical protein AAGI68_15560 [Planctomycetota bacterium]